MELIENSSKITAKAKKREVDDAGFRLRNMTIEDTDLKIDRSTAALKVTNKLSKAKGKRDQSSSKQQAYSPSVVYNPEEYVAPAAKKVKRIKKKAPEPSKSESGSPRVIKVTRVVPTILDH